MDTRSGGAQAKRRRDMSSDNEYLQHAQIIQGVLIFLSACTAVVGYVVQSRLAQAAHKRELEIARRERHMDAKLANMRQLLTTYVGPMQSLLQAAQNAMWTLGISLAGADGLMDYALEYFGGSKELMIKSFKNEVMTMVAQPFLLERFVEEIKAKPLGAMATAYRSTMTVALQRYFLPAAELISTHLNDLPFPSRDDFKKKFPELKTNPQLRKVLLLQLANWVHVMKNIVDNEWAHGDYSHVFPPHLKYPNGAINYLIWMMDSLKDRIAAATSHVESYTHIHLEEEFAETRATLEHKKSGDKDTSKLKQSHDAESKSKPSKSKTTKYVVGTVAGAAGGAAAAIIAGKDR